MTCIDLKATYGRQFRVAFDAGFDEGYPTQHGRREVRDALWLQIISGRLGRVFPHGGDVLAASTNANGPTARRLAALPGAIVHQVDSDGVTVLFPAEQLEAVAALLHLKHRRVVSEKARGRLRVLEAKHGSKHGTDGHLAARQCVPTPQVDSEHHQTPATQRRGVEAAVIAVGAT